MKRILISGYYGFDNAGDEAVLAGLIEGIRARSRSDETKITALSIAPTRTSGLHKIPAMHRYEQLVPAIIRSDLVMSGGGSLLQDVTSAHGIFYYLAVMRMAQILGRKTMFVAQGIGPLKHNRSRKLTAAVAKRLDAITVRDSDSKSLLQSIGVKRRIEVTADPALLLTPSQSAIHSDILLSLREWPTLKPNFLPDLADALRSNGLSTRVFALNMHGEADGTAARTVIQLLRPTLPEPVHEKYRTYRELLQRVSEVEMVVGMRLHSLIFAAACGTPSIALSYDPKVDAFMSELGQSDATIDVSATSLDELNQIIEKVWSSRAVRAEQIRLRLPELRRLAQMNADIALDLLK